MKAWLTEHQEKIEVFSLSSYSPELNLNERLNADLKNAIGSKVPTRTKSRLKAVATEHMTLLKASRTQVITYFQDLRVKYAAS